MEASPKRNHLRPSISVDGVPNPSDSRRQNPLVFVVDDTASIRFLIRTNLELEGFDVAEAVDGQDCLDRLADVAPDIVTIDAVMPRLDGFATVEALRADTRTQHLPIVMVTTQAQAADIKRGTEAGADAYVVKPFDPDALVATVRRVLESAATR